MGHIQRMVTTRTLTIASGSDTTDAFPVGTWAGGVLMVPAGYGSNLTLTFLCAEEEDGTYLPMYDKDGNALGVTMVAGQAFEIPEQVFLADWIKLKIGANAAANETLYLTTKG